jgi:hypothetical protein
MLKNARSFSNVPQVNLAGIAATRPGSLTHQAPPVILTKASIQSHEGHACYSGSSVREDDGIGKSDCPSIRTGS